MNVLSKFVVKHRIWVSLTWVLLLLAGGFAASQLSQRLSLDFSLPGQPGYETQVKLAAAYGSTSDAAYIPVVSVGDNETVEQRKADVNAVFDGLRAIKGLRVVDWASTGNDKFLTADGRSAFAVVYAPQLTSFTDTGVSKQVDAALARGAADHHVTTALTGYEQLTAAGSDSSSGPSLLTETLIGALGALAVLAFVFASLLALVPLLIAGVSILTTFLIVLGLTYLTDVSFVVQFLIALVGLGVAIDYSLLVVSRWREEIAKGATAEEAVHISMRTAGHAVLASGVTVAISLVALVVVPVPLLRSMGLGGMLIPLVSVAVVLTLLPAMLSKFGTHIDVPHIRKESIASRGWTAWATTVVRRPWVAAAVALLILGFAIAPVFKAQFGVANTTSLASSGPAFDTLAKLGAQGVGDGVTSPIVISVKGGDAGAIAAAASGVAGIRSATVAQPAPDGRTAVDVIPDHETVDSSSVAVVDRVHAAVVALPGFEGITGQGATIVDYRKAVYDRFPYVIALIALITFVLLVRTFRSVLLPLKAVVLNLVSLSAVFGLATYFWQQGHGSHAVFGVAPTGAMTFWIPPLIFAFLFGLSMDYEVFILARMREEYDATGSTDAAVIRGLGRTGRLVTSAALILFFSFAALASAPGTDIKVFATALGVGILIDATVVRAILVPALVVLFGRWNWWLPSWLAKVLRVEPSPLRDDEPVVASARELRSSPPEVTPRVRSSRP